MTQNTLWDIPHDVQNRRTVLPGTPGPERGSEPPESLRTRKTDSEYLDFVMTSPKPEYLPCARCGIERHVRGDTTGPYCQACRYSTDVDAVDPEKRTPCFRSQRFWDTEAEVEELVGDGGLSRERRIELRAVRDRVDEEFCGACPIRQACRDWGERDEYTGVAGGEILRNGKPMRQLETAPRPVVRITAAEKYEELMRNGQSRPKCECHGVEMRWKAKTDVGHRGGYWECVVKQRERKNRHERARRARERDKRESELSAA